MAHNLCHLIVGCTYDTLAICLYCTRHALAQVEQVRITPYDPHRTARLHNTYTALRQCQAFYRTARPSDPPTPEWYAHRCLLCRHYHLAKQLSTTTPVG